MVNFEKKNWQLGVTRNMSFFHGCMSAAGHYVDSKKYGVLPLELVYIIKKGRETSVFINQKSYRKYCERIEKVCLSSKLLKMLEEKYASFGKKALKVGEKLESQLKIQNFKEFLKTYQTLTAGLYLTTAIGRHMGNLFFEELKKAYPGKNPQEIDGLIGEITFPKHRTPLIDSEIELLEIGSLLQKKNLSANDIANNGPIAKKFEDYFKKFSVIPVNFNEEPWSREEIISHLEDLMKSDCKSKMELILKGNKQKQEKAKKALRKIISPKIKNIALSLQTGSYLNEYRKYVFCRISLSFRPLFKEIARKYQLPSWKECWKFTPEEITRLYFQEDKKILKVLAQRDLIGQVYATNKNGYRFLSDKELNLFLKDLSQKIPESQATGNALEIKGNIANMGKVRGIAKIIFGTQDFKKFKKGDILVTTMTSVDFVPLMEKAAAFVTNEGGITSHASIVSREMNKPCIIGTKIATQILKDGDLVEVDADKGIVKILKN